MSKTALYLILGGAGTAGAIAVMMMTGVIGTPEAPAPQPVPVVEAPEAPVPPRAPSPQAPLVAEAPAQPVVQPDPATEAPAAAASPVVPDGAPQPGVAPVSPPPASRPVDSAEGPRPGLAPSEQSSAPRPALAAPDQTAAAPDPGEGADLAGAAPAPVETTGEPRPVAAPPAPGVLPDPAETAAAPAPEDAAPGGDPGPADIALLPLFDPGQGAAVPELLFDGDATLIRPSFDVVRAETDGFSLVAGGGEPGALLEVLVNGALAETLTIGGDGKFSVFLELPPSEASVISLRMTKADTVVVSDEEIIVAPAQVAAAEIAPVSRPGGDGPAVPLLETQGGADPALAPGAGTGGAGAPAALAARESAPVRAEDVPGLTPAPRAPDVSPAKPAATVAGPGLRSGSGSPDPATAPAPDDVARAAPLPLAGDVPGPLAAPGATGDPDGAAVPALPDTGGGPVVATAPDAVPGTPPEEAAPADVAAPGAPVVARVRGPGAPASPDSAGLADAARAPADDPAITARAEPDAGAPPASEPRAPAVLLSTPRGVEALSTDPIAPGGVALDAISYNDAGDVLLSGRGSTSAFVRIYLDNTPITTSRIREDGRWRIDLPDVDTGTYTLRVDQIDARGQVLARVESPFLRESAAVLERAVAQGGGAVSSVTIQPGNTLWGISRQRYGDGMQYVRIFEANKDRIRDPDLIYPGQIFDLPSAPTD